MKLTSYGAAEEVTGSCHLVEVGNQKILLDCGLIQGRNKDTQRNRDPFPFDPAALDAVVLSHAHIDHSGRLPVLVRNGFRGPIFTHAASADLCTTLLKDSAYLNERDTQYQNKRRARKGKSMLQPIYSQQDVEETIKLFRAIDFNVATRVTEDCEITLNDSGHILGSAMVSLMLKEKGERRTLVFSGDLGHRGAPILKDFALLDKADLVMVESTYGNRLHRDWSETFDEVSEIVQQVRNSKGNVLIPAFATYLKHVDLYDETAANFWREHGADLSMPNLTFSRSAEDSRKINKMQSGAVVIAGSGMCTGGRIKHHLKHNLWRKESHVVISGYQSYGTLGRKLVNGQSHVKLWGERIKVKAKVHTVGGLSAHADQQGLMDWYANFSDRPPALMVHGETDAMEVLAKRIRDELGGHAHVAKKGKSTDLLALDKLKR